MPLQDLGSDFAAQKSYIMGDGNLIWGKMYPTLKHLAPNNFSGVTLKGMTNRSTNPSAFLL